LNGFVGAVVGGFEFAVRLVIDVCFCSNSPFVNGWDILCTSKPGVSPPIPIIVPEPPGSAAEMSER
jgi:hypothetical protein